MPKKGTREEVNAYHREWRRKNAEKRKAHLKGWRDKNPDYSPYDGMSEEEEKKYRKGRWLKSQYGITVEMYNEVLKEQGNKCASCGEDFVSSRHTHVDHDHSYSKKDPNGFLALLCQGCNVARGFMKNNADAIRGLLRYREWVDGGGSYGRNHKFEGSLEVFFDDDDNFE